MFSAIRTATPNQALPPQAMPSQQNVPFMQRPFNPSELVPLMIEVESQGNRAAYNKKEEAKGILQIRPDVIVDVNDYLSNIKDKNNPLFGMRFKHDDAYDPDKSKQIFDIYTTRYATEQRLGRPPTNADVARMWNGGPIGYRTKPLVRRDGKVLMSEEKLANLERYVGKIEAARIAAEAETAQPKSR